MFHGKGRDDLGFTGVGGIAGTMSFGSVHLIFNAICEIIGNQPYEFIDLGAGTGVMVMMSFAFGAVYACGVEYQPSSLGFVFDAARDAASKSLGICIDSTMIKFDTNISSLGKIITLSSNTLLPQIVFCFCDGWNEYEREHVFHLISISSRVKIFICSTGKGAGDKFSTPISILNALNASLGISTKFAYDRHLAVKMYGHRGAKKTIRVFVRQ